MATLTIPEGTTIQETTRAVYDYTGPGTGPFAIPFPYFDTGDINVYQDGVLKVLDTDYTIVGVAADDGGYQSGQVDWKSSISSTEIIVERAIQIERLSDFTTTGPFPMSALNLTLDKIYAIQQEYRTENNRALRYAASDSTVNAELPDKATRLGQYLYFDPVTGEPKAASLGTTALTVTPYIETLLDDADAAAARTTLGATGLGNNVYTGRQEFVSASYTTSGSTLTLPDANTILLTANHDVDTIANGQIGTIVTLYVVSSATKSLLHGATLILPAARDHIMVAGDIIRLVKTGSTEWRCISWLGHGGKYPLVTGPAAASTGYRDLQVDDSTASQVRVAAIEEIVVQNNVDGESILLKDVPQKTAVLTSTGAGGLDAGSEAASTWYFIYLIYNPETDTSAIILSDNSPTAGTSQGPVLPSGYTHWAHLSAVYNDASSDIQPFTQTGPEYLFISGAVELAMAGWTNNTWTGYLYGTASTYPIPTTTAIVKTKWTLIGDAEHLGVSDSANNECISSAGLASVNSAYGGVMPARKRAATFELPRNPYSAYINFYSSNVTNTEVHCRGFTWG